MDDAIEGLKLTEFQFKAKKPDSIQFDRTVV